MCVPSFVTMSRQDFWQCSGQACCQPDCPANSRTCTPCGASPIILDITGQGFHLTDAQHGVTFDISGNGNPIQMAWTASSSNNAFLVLPGADAWCTTANNCLEISHRIQYP